jgi:hypothetical protein
MAAATKIHTLDRRNNVRRKPAKCQLNLPPRSRHFKCNQARPARLFASSTAILDLTILKVAPHGQWFMAIFG